MQQAIERRSNEERRRTTREALISAARRLFVAKGYADTGTPEIVQAAQVTRGALYHHFADKADLFRAVVRGEFEQIARDITGSAAEDGSGDPLKALHRGSAAFMQAMQEPGRVRLLLLDGPAVLGRLELDAIDRETSADTLKIGLAAAIDAGALRPLPVDALATLLSAMFDRAALAVSQGDNPRDHLDVMKAVLEGLRGGCLPQ